MVEAYKLLRLLLDTSRGLPHFYKSLFLQIASRADATTGIAGVARRLNYQGLAEELYVEPTPGRSEHGTPNKDAIRRGIAYLIKHGYLIHQGPLVFKVPVLVPDKSAKNQSTTQVDPQLATLAHAANTYLSSENDERGEVINHPTNRVISHTSLDTDIEITKGSSNYIEGMDPNASLSVIQIQDFFMEQHHFPPSAAITPKTKPVYQKWVRAGITLSVLSEVVHEVNVANQARGLRQIGSPNYYDKEVMARLTNTETSDGKADPIATWAANSE